MLVVKDLEYFDALHTDWGFKKLNVGIGTKNITCYSIDMEIDNIENKDTTPRASVLIGRFGKGGVNGRVYINFNVDEHIEDVLSDDYVYIDDTFFLPEIVVDLIKEGIIDYE